MVWNETNNWGQFDKAFFLRNGDPRTYRDMQATVADLSFASTVDVSAFTCLLPHSTPAKPLQHLNNADAQSLHSVACSNRTMRRL